MEPGFEPQATRVAEKACRKLVKDMHYEARIKAIITYSAEYEGVKINKAQARQMSLTKE